MNAESAATEQECLSLAFDGPVATLTLRHGSMNAIGDALSGGKAGELEAGRQAGVRRGHGASHPTDVAEGVGVQLKEQKVVDNRKRSGAERVPQPPAAAASGLASESIEVAV